MRLERCCGHNSYSIIFRAVYLDHSHVEAGLSWKLLPDVSGGFRCGRKSRFQGLQLLGFDGGPRPASLSDRALFVVVVAACVFVGQVAALRVLPVILRVLGVRGQTGLAACRHCQEKWTKIQAFCVRAGAFVKIINMRKITWKKDCVFPVGVLIILFANKLEFIQDVQLLSGGQLFVTHHTGETVQVEHFAFGSADKITG